MLEIVKPAARGKPDAIIICDEKYQENCETD